MLSFSVIIPTYAEPERLLDALKSLATQDYPRKQVEIVVVDDGTPDFDPQPIREAVGPLELKLLQNESNQGRAVTRNKGVGAASRDVLLFLDSDMTVKGDFLQAHAEAHADCPDGVVIGNICFDRQISQNALTRYMSSRGVRALGQGEAVPFKCFVTGNSSMRRELLVKAGAFDEAFRAYGGEDLELGYRLHKQGVRFHFAKEAVSFHHHMRSFDQTCRLMKTYGSHSLPLLLTRHPELDRLLRLDFTRSRRFSYRRMLSKLFLSRFIYLPIYMFVRKSIDFFVPDIFFDYVLWYNRTRGFLEAPAA